MRSKVFVTAGNDYRQVNIGGQRQTDHGYSSINADVFVEEMQKVRDKRYRKQEVYKDKLVRVWSGEQAISTRVYRNDDGSENIYISFDPACGLPIGNTSITFDMPYMSLRVDPAEVKLVNSIINSIGSECDVLVIYRILKQKGAEINEEVVKNICETLKGVV